MAARGCLGRGFPGDHRVCPERGVGMPRLTRSDAQTKFLRSFLHSEFGPPVAAWPPPRVFLHWMRSGAFRRELAKLRRAAALERKVQAMLCAEHAWKKLAGIMAEAVADFAARAHEREHWLEVIRRAERWLGKTMGRTETVGETTVVAELEGEVKAEGACEDEREETVEEAAVRLMHPDCRPEVAIALMKGEPHPYYAKEMAEGRADLEETDHPMSHGG